MSRRLRLGKVYPITQAPNRHGLSHAELAEKFLQGGARLLQVRDKQLPDLVFYQQLLEIANLCRAYDAQFLVNDRVDLALAAKAQGVHLGHTDLPVEAARELLGGDAIIGVSTHTAEQFREAQQRDIDYVAVGPVFPTATKESAYPPLGIETVRELAAASRHPVVAIGGITLENAASLWNNGVHSVAVISDLVNSENPAERVRRYLEIAPPAACP